MSRPTFADLFNLKPLEKNNDQSDLKVDHVQNDQLATQSNIDLVKNQPSQNLTMLEPSPANIQPSQNSTRSIFDLLPHYRTPNILDDEICLSLPPSEQVVLRRLFRLSYGFNREYTDNVGVSKIAEKCNISVSTAKTVLKSLEQRGLIEIKPDHSGNPNGGNQYFVLRKYFDSLAKNQPSQNLTRSKSTHIKDDHDFKITDHHQEEVKMIYQTLTRNASWTKSDVAAYEKLKHLPINEISNLIKSTLEKAHQKPASLAYFAKAYQNPTQANPANKQAIKSKIAAIVQRKQEAHVGARYTISDLTYDVKTECIREGIAFDNEIFNEVVEKKI